MGNKAIIVLCSVIVGMCLGRIIFAPDSVTVATWFAMVLNIVAIFIQVKS